jgi:hypothetical protein
LAAAMLLFASSPALPARAAPHHVVVLNQGNSAIFYLRVGNASNAKWSADLLGYDGVIDVGRGQDVVLDIDDTSSCTYDLQATYADGSTQIAPGVDLCSTERVSFFESLPSR